MNTFNLKEELANINISKDGEMFVDSYKGTSTYICDAISEQADSEVDIYYSDLFEWAKHNFSYIEEANEELGAPNDIIKQIQQAQFLYNERALYDELEEIILFAVISEALDYAEEVTEEQLDSLHEVADKIDHNNRFDDISDEVSEIFNTEEEEGE